MTHKAYGPYERFVKRPLDFFLALLVLLIFSPVWMVTAILVRIKLGSPVLFKQERPGKDEKLFCLRKFRTMTDARNEKGQLLPDDVRLTGFGRGLRSTSLDELPELLNIVRGEMAIVGPRPLLKEYLPYYTEEERRRHEVRPGLTGYAQVHGRNTGSWEEKFQKDLQYVDKISFWGDTKIILETLVKVIKRSDIQVGSEIAAGRLDQARSKTASGGEKCFGIKMLPSENSDGKIFH